VIDRLPHVREPSSGEPDVCVHCLEEWVDLLTLYERDECSVRLRAALDAERATVAALRASVPPLHPADYGHEAWTVALVEAKKEGARSAVEERAAERVAVVAWLRAEAYLTLYEATPEDVADCIERGEHRRGESAP